MAGNGDVFIAINIAELLDGVKERKGKMLSVILTRQQEIHRLQIMNYEIG